MDRNFPLMPIPNPGIFHWFFILTGFSDGVLSTECNIPFVFLSPNGVCSAQTQTGIGHLSKPPGVELIPCHRKPLRRTHTLRDPAQTQVWSKQVWLDTTFISQGLRSWGKLAVETWRVKTELIIITILHITITTTSILDLGFKTIALKILAHIKCINKYWKYTQIFAATKSSKIMNYWRLPKILANTWNIGVTWNYWRISQILASHENIGGYPKYLRLLKT